LAIGGIVLLGAALLVANYYAHNAAPSVDIHIPAFDDAKKNINQVSSTLSIVGEGIVDNVLQAKG
jgi:hypothetical protein